MALIEGVAAAGRRRYRGAGADELSLFEIGSVSKVLTGVLLAEMALRGEVGLDDPLSRHRPGPAPAWREREPTLGELATHRSGLPNVPSSMARGEFAYGLGLSRRDPWSGVTVTEYAEAVRETAAREPPGRAFRYSSMGVGLLGDALAARAGATYDELLRDRILGPLGMDASGVGVTQAWAGHLLAGHSARGRPRPPLADHMAAAGGVRSNARDMLTLLTAALAPADDALGRALALSQRPRAAIGRGAAIGLCWLVTRRRRGPRIVWHNGGTWGFRSFAVFAPELDRAAVVLRNRARSVDRRGYALLTGEG